MVKRRVKWLVAMAAAVVLVAIAALVALPLLVDTPRVQALIAGSAAGAVGRPVKFTSLSVRVFPRPTVELHGLEVAEDPGFGTAPFLRLDTGTLQLRLRPLLAGRVEFGELVLKQPTITLSRTADGRWNVASLGATHDGRSPVRPGRGGGAAAAGGVLGSRVRIDDGVLVYAAPDRGSALTKYRVEHLDLTLTGGGPSLAFEGGARVKPGDLAIKITRGKVSLNGARPATEAPLAAHVVLEGKDVRELVASFVGASPAIGGPLKASLSVGGTLGAPRASGDVEFASLRVTQTPPQCPDPEPRSLTLGALKMSVVWDEGRFTASPLTTGLGQGTITTNVVATANGTARVRLGELAVKGLPLDRVLVDFLCQGYAVTGPLDLTGVVSMSPANPWPTLAGAGQLKIGPGKVVGPQALSLLGGLVRGGGAISTLLAADLPSPLFASPLDFDSITATYQITNGVVATRDLLYTSRAMKVAVAGEYGLATRRMNLDLVVNHGRGEIRAKVTGTSASPSIRVLPSTIVRQLEPGKVERELQDLLKRFR